MNAKVPRTSNYLLAELFKYFLVNESIMDGVEVRHFLVTRESHRQRPSAIRQMWTDVISASNHEDLLEWLSCPSSEYNLSNLKTFTVG